MFYPALYISLLFAAAGFLFQIYRLSKANKSWQTHKKFQFHLTPAFFNTIFQTRLFKASKIRWMIHFLVFSGFLYLLIFHALADLTSVKWFNYYQPTVDPFQFLRNFTGLMVAIGCLGFLFKKKLNVRSARNIKGKFQNLFSIILIFLLVFSGFMLEAVKIISEPLFMEMVEDYAGIDEDSGLDDLKVYWEKNYNVVFKNSVISSKEALEEGEILNEDYCLECHSNISSAFVSKPMAEYLKETAQVLNEFRADNWLYHIHYLLSFLILICIPFTRLFHILLIPFASLKQKSDLKEFQKEKISFHPVTMDACTGCMLCSEVCSVYPNFLIAQNINVLPHAKVNSSKKMILGYHIDFEELSQLQISNNECTMCNNCTNICPSGIDLQGLWMTLSQALSNMDLKPIPSLENIQFNKAYDIIPGTESFDNCVQCTICTNVCPIVEHSSIDENDMTPQQIMNLLRLGKRQMASQTRMVGNCLTCYACQESCPGEIKVTDIMIELRQAIQRV